MSPSLRLPASRRTALTGAVGTAVGGALVLAGCEGGDPPASGPSPASSTALTTPGSSPESTPEDPDAALVATVVAELDALIAFASAAAAARPGIAAWPAAFETLHRTHRAVLTDDEEDTRRPRVRGSAQEVVGRVTRREEQAQRRFAGWAIDAESGRLARLLASMSAAVAQQLAAPTGSTT